MNTFILNLSDSTASSIVDYTPFLDEVLIKCNIPNGIDCIKVIGTIDFKNVVFDRGFYNAIKGDINILDLSDLKSSSSYDSLRLGLNNVNKFFSWKNIKEIILPDKLCSMPMIRNLPELRKVVGLGLKTFNNESRTDCICDSNLSGCIKLEEIVFGSEIKNITIRHSTIKRINIPESNGLLRLEPYGFAYNDELEEVHIPQDMRVLPIRLFEGCKKLRTVSGGTGLEKIEFGVFGGCKNLQKLPFKIGLLNENQFLSYDEWMQYEPDNHRTSRWSYGDCAHCPKGKWSEIRHEWDEGCNLKKYYCRDDDQRKWKPYKKGIVLSNGYIWCFDDFNYYKTDIEVNWRRKPEEVHKYVEFLSPNIIFSPEGDYVNIIYNPQEKKAKELSFPHHELAETINSYFNDISYEQIVDEITKIVNGLDIEAIIDSYKTTFTHEYFKMNSDTEGESYNLDRGAKYTDEYLINLLPFIHEHHDDRTACVAHISDFINNPYKEKFDFKLNYCTYDKNEEDLFSYRIIGCNPREIEYLKNEDSNVRQNARERYNKKDHIDFLVNCRISEIINKKLDIESKLHIRQAEKEFYKRNK